MDLDQCEELSGLTITGPGHPVVPGSHFPAREGIRLAATRSFEEVRFQPFAFQAKFETSTGRFRPLKRSTERLGADPNPDCGGDEDESPDAETHGKRAPFKTI